MRDDIPKMVEREFRKRQIKHGLPVNRWPLTFLCTNFKKFRLSQIT